MLDTACARELQNRRGEPVEYTKRKLLHTVRERASARIYRQRGEDIEAGKARGEEREREDSSLTEFVRFSSFDDSPVLCVYIPAGSTEDEMCAHATSGPQDINRFVNAEQLSQTLLLTRCCILDFRPPTLCVQCVPLYKGYNTLWRFSTYLPLRSLIYLYLKIAENLI